ncbi:MAG: MBL fold metallo-hydrolase [Methanosarcinaceae archaeon]|nr:MBL fold metallo-hydrolase [Methanosarcinaceae archaeon]
MSSTKIGNVTINWLGHSGFMIEGEGKTIYIDPYVLPDNIGFEDMADIILITHEHYDHCNPEAIRKLRKEDTTTLIPENCSLKFRGDARNVMEGDVLTGGLAIKDMDIEVVPAYNINKPNHPKGFGVGYIIKVEGIRIYHAGDTDFIPEMKEINVDVALLPIGGNYTMDESEAAEAAAVIAPKVVIPMHYNYLETTRADAGKFKKMVNEKNPDIEVVIL